MVVIYIICDSKNIPCFDAIKTSKANDKASHNVLLVCDMISKEITIDSAHLQMNTHSKWVEFCRRLSLPVSRIIENHSIFGKYRHQILLHWILQQSQSQKPLEEC